MPPDCDKGGEVRAILQDRIAPRASLGAAVVSLSTNSWVTPVTGTPRMSWPTLRRSTAIAQALRQQAFRHPKKAASSTSNGLWALDESVAPGSASPNTHATAEWDRDRSRSDSVDVATSRRPSKPKSSLPATIRNPIPRTQDNVRRGLSVGVDHRFG